MCTNTLTGVQKDNVLIELISYEPLAEGGGGIIDGVDNIIIYDDFNRRVKSDQTCVGTVMPDFKKDALGNETKLIETKCQSFRVRKLTPKECWRLMGFSDEDFCKAKASMNQNLYGGKDRSDSQLYKQAGNSIVVDVLCAIMKELYVAMPYLFDDMVVGSFFSGIGAFEKALSTFDIADISSEVNHPYKNNELKQLGFINNYNGNANRVYDSETVACTLKAEAGGGWSQDRMVCHENAGI